MRTPKKIRNGLECCKNGECEDCRYLAGSGSWSCVGRLIKDVFAYVQQLEAQQPRWISVNDRLPERGITRCIIAVKLGNGLKGTLCARYNADLKSWSGWYSDKITNEVTHWMPLPQPPEED